MPPRRRCFICREFAHVVKCGGRRVCEACRPQALAEFRAEVRRQMQAEEAARLADVEAGLKPTIFDRERVILGWMRQG